MCRCTSWGFPRCAYVLPTYRACTSILPAPRWRRRGRGLRVDSCIFLTVRYTHTHLGTPAGRQPWHGCCSVVDRAAADRAALALTRSTREIGPGGALCSAPQLIGQCRTERSSWLVAVKLCRVGKQGTQFRDLSLEPSVLLC